MIVELFTIKDKRNGYEPATAFVNKEIALRWFTDQVRNTRVMREHPDDFEMYYLGKFDTSNAKHELLEEKELIEKGENVIGE